MTTDLGGLQAKLDTLADKMTGARLHRLVTQIAAAGKKDMLEIAKRDLGGDLSFSGWRAGRLKLNIGFEVRDTTAVFQPRPSGPWSVLESGRTSGAVAPKRGRKARVLKTPAGPRTFTVAKPLRIGSTRGKESWTKAEAELRKRTPARVQKAVREILSEVF